MKFLALAVLALAASASAGQLGDIIENEYIVVFKAGVTAQVRGTHMSLVDPKDVMHEYNVGGKFQGYAAKMTNNLKLMIEEQDEVDYIEQNKVVVAFDCEDFANQQSWGITRTIYRDLRLDNTYRAEYDAGASVTQYVIDTGVYLEHQSFGGRAKFGTNTVDNDNTDGNGHGTHVGGTMVGEGFGIARGSEVIGVKVLSAGGSGSTAGVIAGVDWTASDARGKRAVANMSLGGSRSTAMNAAVDAAVDAGVVMVSAAGNDNWDACNYSPASAEKSFTVGSTTSTDARSSFSNYGSCVDIFAPGSSITSAYIGGPTRTASLSGTSMAAPHVAGVVGKYMDLNPSVGAEQVVQDIIRLATEDAISNPGSGSPNKLLYMNCEA